MLDLIIMGVLAKVALKSETLQEGVNAIGRVINNFAEKASNRKDISTTSQYITKEDNDTWNLINEKLIKLEKLAEEDDYNDYDYDRYEEDDYNDYDYDRYEEDDYNRYDGDPFKDPDYWNEDDFDNFDNNDDN
ncbi:MAG: hypothetical protein H6630_00195 [Arcobacter sp.]|nr:hypothetical protein [Arcobacter sp.]